MLIASGGTNNIEAAIFIARLATIIFGAGGERGGGSRATEGGGQALVRLL